MSFGLHGISSQSIGEGENIIRGLSLTQPWATLVANGSKRIETRSWSTSYRGPLAIHASKGFPGWAKDFCYDKVFQRHLRRNEADQFYIKDVIKSLPRGAIIATANLVKCLSTDGAFFKLTALNFESKDGQVISNDVRQQIYKRPAPDSDEFAFGDYSRGRYMWFLEDVIALPEPIACKGALSLWEVPAEIEARIENERDK